jgi:hypothetical protein
LDGHIYQRPIFARIPDLRLMPDFRLMIVLDTNILSELMRATPAGAIERWLGE